MDKIKILGLQSDKQSIMQLLQAEGVVELIDTGLTASLATEDDVVEPNSKSSLDREYLLVDEKEQQTISEQELLIRQKQANLESVIIKLDNKYPNISIEPADLRISIQDLLAIKKREKAILSKLEQVQVIEDRESDLAAEREQIQREQDILQDWYDVDINLAQTSTERTVIFLGQLEKSALKQLEDELVELSLAQTVILDLFEGDRYYLTAIIALKEDQLEVDNLLKRYDFNALPIKRQGKPNRIYQANTAQLERIDSYFSELEQELKEIAKNRLDFYILSDYYSVLLDYYAANKIPQNTLYTFSLQGFLPREKSADVVRQIESNYSALVEIQELTTQDDYPIMLKNNPFSGAYQTILEMFGAPNTQEIDPTPGLAPFTFLFFGMMLSDVGYGLLLTLACAFLLWKRKIDATTESGKLVRMLFLSGISSTIWGFVFGGFFGDMLTLLSDKRISFPYLWFNPMDEPQKLLIWSMIFGVIHLFGGMIMRMINEVKYGRISNIIFDIIPWFFIIIGLGMMVGGSSLNITSFNISELGKWFALGGGVIVLLFAGRDKKNIFSRLISGVGGLYGVINYLGDILSYTRVLALVLATSVIATVVNFLAVMVSGGVIGWIFAILILMGGHMLNLALSGLSAYVHSSRLQYVEFFGQFFEGGGRFFKPFSYQTKRIKLKKENINQQEENNVF